MKRFLLTLFSLIVAGSSFFAGKIYADNSGPIPPKGLIPCPAGSEDPNFNSLRPYQASPCGGTVKAIYCSNDLNFIEDFKVAGEGDCKKRGVEGEFDCNPNHYVGPHNLYVDLADANFPIEGNTELTPNSQNNTDQIDDATKMNEYVSWYLNGVNNRAEFGSDKNNGDTNINFSGPIQKLMPQVILESQRISTIKSIAGNVAQDAEDQDTPPPAQPGNHNQIVVCAKKKWSLPLWFTNFFSLPSIGLGNEEPVECYPSANSKAQGDVYRLGGLGNSWDGSNDLQDILNWATDHLSSLYPSNAVIQVLANAGNRWSLKTPPLPWSDQNGKPFTTQEDYQKAYNEWRGQVCAFLDLPIFGKKLVCLGAWPLINNPYADLFPYVPLAQTVDKHGTELVTSVQPHPSQGTDISGWAYSKAVNAPLYFAHTEETKDLSEFLNKSYTPKDVKSVPEPQTTENNKCSAVNVRSNPGDNLFPGYPHGIEADEVTYTITQAHCVETITYEECGGSNYTGGRTHLCKRDTLSCPAEVIITIATETKTPFADEIFASTVADSGSTFRKIYPKVEAGAPVSCIADIPTVTNVTYDGLSKSQKPAGGTLDFKVDPKPSDGGATKDAPQLTFPHIGSVYDYFLKGIQTALRPQGYADPTPVSGNMCGFQTSVGACKQWLFEKDSKGQYYYDKIIQAAAATTCNGKSLNPFWAVTIALNENGGLMTDDTKGYSNSHFGCNISQKQSIEDKTSCMTNTLRINCEAGLTDQQSLRSYGYPPNYEFGPMEVLTGGGTILPPLFGSGFNTSQLKINLLNTDWWSYYKNVAPTFCPNTNINGPH